MILYVLKRVSSHQLTEFANFSFAVLPVADLSKCDVFIKKCIVKQSLETTHRISALSHAQTYICVYL